MQLEELSWTYSFGLYGEIRVVVVASIPKLRKPSWNPTAEEVSLPFLRMEEDEHVFVVVAVVVRLRTQMFV